MPGNPLVDQGSLNRLFASLVIPAFPSLNVTSPFLTREGIRLALEGEATTYIPTMTGAVTSPQPYQIVTITINLIKSQIFSNLWEQQKQTDTRLGQITVTPDSTTLFPYVIQNCAIETTRELNFSGEEASFVIGIKGFYAINNDLWS